MKESCHTHEYETGTQTEPKMARNLVLVTFSLQYLIPNNVATRYINEEFHLVSTTCALSPTSCKDSHDLHLLSVSWNKDFSTNRRCSFPKRIATDEREIIASEHISRKYKTIHTFKSVM